MGDETLEWKYSLNGALESRTSTNNETSATTSYQYDGLGNLREVVLPDDRVIEYVMFGFAGEAA